MLRLDELNINGYKIYQDPSQFCFGVDAVFLAAEAQIKKTDRVIDICSGSGIIPLLLLARGDVQNITMVEYFDYFCDLAKKSAELNGMGTTTVIAVIKDGTAVIAHVGDSRAYLAGEELKLITRDHSIVQSLVESGKITPEDAKVHPKKNIITRALGTEENVVADFCEIKLENDVLLLCTDGLSGYAEEKDIFDCLNKNTDTVADELINLAKVGGGGDNITVVTISDK